MDEERSAGKTALLFALKKKTLSGGAVRMNDNKKKIVEMQIAKTVEALKKNGM